MPTKIHPIVGSVRWEPVKPVVKGGPIQILDGWDTENIISVPVPQLNGIPSYGNSRCGGTVRFYRGAADQLRAAWAEVERQGLMNRVIFWGGSWTERLMVSSKTTPSNHAFGTAFDINVAWNGYGVPPAPQGKRGSVVELAPIFEQFGFVWGGKWRTPDGMHFEIGRIIAPQPAVMKVPIIVNGQRLSIDAELRDGRSWAPARALATALGATVVGWQAETSSVTVNRCSVPGELRGQTAWVRVADLARAAGVPAPVWDAANGQVVIRTA